MRTPLKNSCVLGFLSTISKNNDDENIVNTMTALEYTVDGKHELWAPTFL